MVVAFLYYFAFIGELGMAPRGFLWSDLDQKHGEPHGQGLRSSHMVRRGPRRCIWLLPWDENEYGLSSKDKILAIILH